MNELQITVNPYKGINEATLDGNPLSPYSELSNYLQQPVLHWADKLCGIAERQINDSFKLQVTGESFDTLFFGDLVAGSDLCEGYEGKAFRFSSAKKRFDGICKLAQKYSCKNAPEHHQITACADSADLTGERYVRPAAVEDAFLVLTHNASALDAIPQNGKPRLILLIGKDAGVSLREDGSYIWEISNDRLRPVLEAIVERFAKIPFIVAAAKELSASNSLSDYDRQFLSLVISIEPLVSVDKIDKIEVGFSAKLSAKAIPEGAWLPEVRVVSQNPDIIKADGLTLTAVAPGKAMIEVFKGSEFDPIARMQIDAFQDKRAKQIRLDRKEPNMCIGRTQKIDLAVEPADAEDAAYIIWAVDDPSVAEVDGNGILTAKAPGRVLVTASTSHVRESVIVDVLPNIEQMMCSQTDVCLMKGDTAPIAVSYAPAKCFDNSCSWTSSNTNVAYVETYIDGTSAIIAKDIGECTLTCVANEGGCSVSCHVEVLDPVEEEKKRKKNVDLICLVGIPLAIVLFLLFLASLAR